MRSRVLIWVFGVLFCCGECWCQAEPETPDWRTTLKTIRNGIHKIDTYLNAALDLFGGYDGLCQYQCTDGKLSPCPCCGHIYTLVQVAVSGEIVTPRGTLKDRRGVLRTIRGVKHAARGADAGLIQSGPQHNKFYKIWKRH